MNNQSSSEPATNGRGDSDAMERMTFRLPADDKAHIETLVDDDSKANESAVVRTAVQLYLRQYAGEDGGEIEDCPTVELRQDRLDDLFSALEAALKAASECRPTNRDTVDDCLNAVEDAYRHLLSAHPRYRTHIHTQQETDP